MTLLDVQVKPKALRQILEIDAERYRELLAEVPVGRPLWEASDTDLLAATRCWDELREQRGIDWVIAGKLLARKRPELVPIYDSVVQREMHLSPHDPFWFGLRQALAGLDVRAIIEAWRPPGAWDDLSLLRLLDIAAWMEGSRSSAAAGARRAVDAVE